MVSFTAVSVSCLTAFTTLIITLLLFHRLYCVRNNYFIPNWFKLPSLIACIFYVLSSIIFTISFFYVDTRTQMEYALTCFICLAISIFLSKFFTYITLLSRLFWTFNQSAYKISNCLLKTLVCVLILSLFAIIWLSILFCIKFESKHSKYEMSDRQILMIAIQIWIGISIIVVTDIIISVTLLYLFIKKLLLLTTHRKRTFVEIESNSPSNVGNVNHSMMHKYSIQSSKSENSYHNKLLNNTDLITIDAMTKYTILNSMAIVVSQIQFICLKFLVAMQLLYLNGILNNDSIQQLNPAKIRDYMAVSIFPADQIINCLVLLLNFKFNEAIYWKLCSCVHIFVKRKFIIEVETGVKELSGSRKRDLKKKKPKVNSNKIVRKSSEMEVHNFETTTTESETDTTETESTTTDYWISTKATPKVSLNENINPTLLIHNINKKQSAMPVDFTAPNDVDVDIESNVIWSLEQ